MKTLTGAYHLALSARYRLSLPVAYRAAFHNDPPARLTVAGQHWTLYPAAAYRAWIETIQRTYEESSQPLPSDLLDQVNHAPTVTISKAGMLIIPAVLRVQPPGQVVIVGLATILEIWPVVAWHDHMTTSMKTLRDTIPPALLDQLAP